MISWKDITWKGAPSGNYTEGRPAAPRFITMHHVVGSMESVNNKVQNTYQYSCHFTVGERGIWQFVDTDNISYCNANWASNQESITIEHEGDWRNGYRNEGCIENSAQLIALIRKTHPSIIGFQRHNQVAQTACPCDLPCEEIWNRSTQILNPPAPVPAPAPPATSIQITDIQNRVVLLNKDANLWDLNFNTWAEAKSVKVIPKGTEVEISAIAKHPLGGSYYMTEYSFSKGIKNGINVADCEEKPVPPVVVPPVVVPPVVVPPVVTPPVVTPPVDPNLPIEGEDAANWLKRIFQWVMDLLSKFKFKK